MEVELQIEDFKGDYFSHNDCPLARALKREGYKNITVFGTWVDFGNNKRMGILNANELVGATEIEPQPFTVYLDINLIN